MIRLVVALILTILALVLALQNKTEVVVSSLFGYQTDPVPLYLVILIAFVSGAAATLVFTIPPWIRNKVEIRKLKRTLQKMEEDDHGRAA
jgi:uncharacterized integral membrane protein